MKKTIIALAVVLAAASAHAKDDIARVTPTEAKTIATEFNAAAEKGGEIKSLVLGCGKAGQQKYMVFGAGSARGNGPKVFVSARDGLNELTDHESIKGGHRYSFESELAEKTIDLRVMNSGTVYAAVDDFDAKNLTHYPNICRIYKFKSQ